MINNIEFTGADGIMSAEGILDNPALFYNNCNNGDSSPSPDKVLLALEYIELVNKYPVKMKSIIFHIRRMIRDELIEYQLMDDVIQADSLIKVEKIVKQVHSHKVHGGYSHDIHKAKKMKEAAERRKVDEGKRKSYEERMIRKAKREGKSLDHYLQLGSDNPTIEEIQELKAMPDASRFEVWKQKHQQHCFAYHFNTDGCNRERTCSFLHADAGYSESVAFG